MAQTLAAPQRGEVARACERACGVPCNLCVTRDQATQQNAAVDGAVVIAQKEAAHWYHGMAIHSSAVAAIWDALTAAAAGKAAVAPERREAEAAAQEAAAGHESCPAKEAMAKKEAEVKAL